MSEITSPAVSVILPTYNRAELLGRAIRSVLAQTSQDFEVVVVDDGSKDNTEEVAHSFGDPRIRYIRQQENRGISAARNVGIGAALGEYITFLDSDDEYFPTKLEYQLEVFSRAHGHAIGAVACGLIEETPQGNLLRLPPSRCTLEDVFGLRAYMPNHSLCVERKYFEDGVSFDESMTGIEEWDYLIQLLQKGCRLAFIDIPLYVIHYHKGPRLSDPAGKLQQRSKLLQKYSPELKVRPRARSNHHFAAAVNYYEMGDMRGARRHFYKAVKASPWQLRRYLFLVASLGGSRVFKQFYQSYGRLGSVRSRPNSIPTAGSPQEYLSRVTGRSLSERRECAWRL